MDVGNLQYHPPFSGSKKSDMFDNQLSSILIARGTGVFKYCTNLFLREFVGWFYAVEELKFQ